MAEKKRGSERTTLTLSLSVEDKRALKQMALDNNTTVAKLVHQWLKERRPGVRK